MCVVLCVQGPTSPLGMCPRIQRRADVQLIRNATVPPTAQLFDASGPSPALVHLLGSGTGLVEVAGKRAFVPGCGRGYDIAALVGAGAAQAVGLELAPTAVAAAREHLAQQPGLSPEAASVVEGDFFQVGDERQGSGQY